jgi:hypothetical protein
LFVALPLYYTHVRTSPERKIVKAPESSLPMSSETVLSK